MKFCWTHAVWTFPKIHYTLIALLKAQSRCNQWKPPTKTMFTQHNHNAANDRILNHGCQIKVMLLRSRFGIGGTPNSPGSTAGGSCSSPNFFKKYSSNQSTMPWPICSEDMDHDFRAVVRGAIAHLKSTTRWRMNNMSHLSFERLIARCFEWS